MNQMQIIQMLKSGKNPQQVVMNMLQSQMGQTPMGQNLLALAQDGQGDQIEQIARNICQQRGVNFDEAFTSFKQTLGL